MVVPTVPAPKVCFHETRGHSRAHLKYRVTRTLLLLGTAVAMSFAAVGKPVDSFTPAAARVIILANADDASSLAVAEHYAQARHVPGANIVALSMPTAETITWAEFIPRIWEPLMARLVGEGWIDAIPMNLTDAVGRRKYAVHSHRIAAMVVCRGVPLRIAHDPALYVNAPPFTRRAEFRTNGCAVDAELSLLPEPNHPINAFVPNPLFQNEHPTDFDQTQIIKVSRLDGPSADDANGLVDRALIVERDGLRGRAYVDLSDRDEIGNGWLNAAAKQLRELGFDTDVDAAPALMPLDARIDAPALYFGWYSSDLGGAFDLPGFRFPPGAVALHIHSYSAATLRSTTQGWAGPLVARGVTATVGNVYEPYLQLTHRPDLLVRALARGATLADAAYFSLQALSWQEVLIGDPLYRPFAVSLDAQLAAERSAPDSLSNYAVLRRVNQVEQAGRAAAALALLRDTQRSHPSLPVGVALAVRLKSAGDLTGAADALLPVARHASWTANEWALARQAAMLLKECGHPDAAVVIWRAVLDSNALPPILRRGWLHDAIAAAHDARDEARAAEWHSELEAWSVPAAR